MARSDYDIWLEHLARKRAPAVAEAEGLLDDDRYDEAERAIVAVDDSIYGEVEIARLYHRRLEQLVALGVTDASRARVEEVFRRALSWAHRAYPEPHTALEATQYDTGRAEDRARLVRILGYEP